MARLERTLDAEQRRAARDLAAHDRDRRIAQRQLRVAEGALHRAVRDGWLGAEEARAALADGGRGAVKQHMGIWRDLRVKRRPTEVDVLTGVVVTRGRELGIATPVNAAILDLVHAIEVGQTGMGWENLRAIAERAGLMTTV